MIEPQRLMLGDAVRNRAFAEALRRAITPGRTRVADLGTGTGFLAALAARAGAASVWACEAEEGLAALARKTLAANRLPRLRVETGHSTDLMPPTPVDLVVAEVLGNLATEEHLVETLTDARRFLAPGGAMIPCGVEHHVCPVTDPATQRGIDVWPGIGFDYDLTAARRVSLNNLFVRTIDPAHLLDGGAAAQVWERLAFPGQNASRRQGSAVWTLSPAVRVYGFAVWWEATLVPGVVLSTSPLAAPTHWQQIYLPLLEPLDLRADDRLHLDISTDTRPSAGCRVRWSGRQTRRDREVARFAMDNLAGCP